MNLGWSSAKADNLGVSYKMHQQNSTFATPIFDISHEQFSFYSQTRYVKSLFLIQRRFSEIFR